MAEFKLGRIKFVWQGEWVTAKAYVKDDIIRYGGQVYICVQAHTAGPDFYLDSAYWNVMSDGQNWVGNWDINTYYKKGDVVKYGGLLYVANNGHTSAGTITLGLEQNQGDWDLYTENTDWKGDWVINTRYKVNDLVKYGGNIYLCNTYHTSSTTVATDIDGLEADLAKWDIYSKGFDWKNVWVAETRYKPNDLVRYGGQLYVCITGHLSGTDAQGLEADQAKWEYFHKGVLYRNDWAASTRYRINDIVKYGANIWICTTYHTSTTSLAADEANWEKFVPGLEFEDTWAIDVQYQPGDIVAYGGYSYIATTNNKGKAPYSNTNDWDLYLKGFNLRGDWGDDSTTQDYYVGDVVRVGGYTYLCIKDHADTAIKPPNTTYWERLNQGFEWQGDWTNVTEYDLGDIVYYGVNSYIVVQAHTSNQSVGGRRPDLDTGGNYYKIIAGGNESSALTTDGDLLYYSGAGPTRLPIGNEGDVLVVNDNNMPEWSVFGRTDHVYYVGPTGTDGVYPQWGATVDRPFASIRYATEAIEWGVLNNSARQLLEHNRHFIQEQVVEYIDYQTTNSVAPFVGFTYPISKADLKSRIGWLVDRVALDLGKGGNTETRELALEYFDDFVGANTAVANAMNYVKTLADAVLTNLDPAQNYATLNSVATPVPQYKNNDWVEEAGAQDRVEALISIVSDAVAVEDSSTVSIPAEEIVNKTIFVKTGRYYEVLPIIVPKFTAVVGDELRSTNIRPATAEMFTQASDTNYSIAGYKHLKSIISNVIQGSGITKTPSNTKTQSTASTLNFSGTSSEGSIVEARIQEAIDYVEYYVNNTAQDSTPPVIHPYASSVVPSNDDNVYGAIEMLKHNTEFLAEEVTAYITATYPAYSYAVEKCKRDVRKYIEGFIWELKHGGNYRTIYNARYYANAVNGSLTEDMFYLRDGTGLRNCTVQGLTGVLSAPNDYGTRRPTAGSFTSLDPGWGPNDPRVWIQTRSPYVQNVTTFGTGCIGCKIDGNLHDGGNDSIVANDFTQVLSDGIGVWCTNLGRTELVSVFSYYGHIGYLAENGGKIRATNGNSSYGTFGTVAEGVDPTEIPVTGTVNNRNREATIDNVITNQSQILRVEYSNAGVHYTNATFDFAGDGTGAIAYADEFRDSGIFDIRMLDNDVDADGEGDFGGNEYSFAGNTAQTGSDTQIVISNTDTANTGQYNGMRIVITSGLGVGQYGYIGTYGAGSKEATVFRESDGAAGFDHLIPGTAIATLIDGTTKYEIEPRITVPHPGYADSQQGVGAALQYGRYNWGIAGGRIIAVGQNVQSTLRSDDGTTFAPGGNLPSGQQWGAVTGDGSDNWVALGYGTSIAVFSADNGVSWTQTTIPNGNWLDTAWSKVNDTWVAITEDSTVGAYSVDSGASWTQTAIPSTTGSWKKVLWGRNEFIAIASDGQGARSSDGITWNGFGLPIPTVTDAQYHDITWGNGRYIVTLDRGDKYYYSLNGTTWTEATYPSYMHHEGFIEYQMGTFVWAQAKQGQIKTINNIGAADSNRTLGTYTGVSATGSATGQDAEFTVDVDGSGACTITVTNPGKLYAVADTLTIAAANIGGTGTNITFDVATVTSGNEGAQSPDGIVWTQRTNTGIASPAEFAGLVSGSVANRPQWFRIQTSTANQNKILTGAQALLRAVVATGKIARMKILEPGSGYVTTPTITITDPSNTIEAPFEVRVGNGVLAQPTMLNRGIAYETATATVDGNGYADKYQPGANVYLEGLTEPPLAGSNVTFSSITSETYPNTYDLLTLNKEFLKDEVIAWINAQVAGATGIWVGFSYDQAKCERDTGYIVDAIAHDIKFGGNLQTLTASKSYWDGATSQVAGQQAQTTAAIEQLKTIINDYILVNQTYTPLQSPVVTTQTITGTNGENETISKVTYLLNIMIDVITNGLANIPAEKGINNPFFKLVTVRELLGTGPYTARVQLSPDVPVNQAPEHGDTVELRIRYSQVRLTGHDFLDIGTGNFTNTNYPGIPLIDPDATKETVQYGGGRVFFTSTDQDGNFRVGDLFSVEQSTGVATLDADAFNIAGLNELSLGSVELGGTGAVITEFSTDGTFAANSDSVVPTQRAIRTYINAQIGGGNSELNVNIMTAGVIEIKEDQIDTTTGVEIKVKAKMNFLGGVDGDIVALQRMLLS
jgi:hypothetical protein